MSDSATLASSLATLVTSTHALLPKPLLPLVRSNGVPEWVALAGVALASSRSPAELRLVSLGAGSKVLSVDRRSTLGDVVNDMHAEVLAVRGARRWLAEEILRAVEGGGESEWMEKSRDGGREAKWKMKDGVRCSLYISTMPCEFACFSLPRCSRD